MENALVINENGKSGNIGPQGNSLFYVIMSVYVVFIAQYEK